MADENEEKDDASGEEEEKKGGGKAKLIIIILAGLLLLGGAAGGTLYFLGFFESEEVEEEGEEKVDEEDVEKEEVVKRAPAMYFPIRPAFVVNFQSRGRQRFLQVDVALMTRNSDVYAAIQEHLPLIKNRLVMLFGGQIYEEIQSDEGRELLRQKALEAVKEIMEQEVGSAEIDQVLFTNFVMQ